MKESDRAELFTYLQANMPDDMLLSTAHEVRRYLEVQAEDLAAAKKANMLGAKKPTVAAAPEPTVEKVEQIFVPGKEKKRMQKDVVDLILRHLKNGPDTVVGVNRAINGKASHTQDYLFTMHVRGMIAASAGGNYSLKQ